MNLPGGVGAGMRIKVGYTFVVRIRGGGGVRWESDVSFRIGTMVKSSFSIRRLLSLSYLPFSSTGTVGTSVGRPEKKSGVGGSTDSRQRARILLDKIMISETWAELCSKIPIRLSRTLKTLHQPLTTISISLLNHERQFTVNFIHESLRNLPRTAANAGSENIRVVYGYYGSHYHPPADLESFSSTNRFSRFITSRRTSHVQHQTWTTSAQNK